MRYHGVLSLRALERAAVSAGAAKRSGLSSPPTHCLRRTCLAAWKTMGFNVDSVVLLIGTEGATDPEFYAQTVAAE